MLGIFRGSQYHYSRLSSTGDHDEETLASKSSVGAPLTHPTIESALPKRLRIARHLVTLCVFCTIANVAILFHSRLHPSTFSLSLYELQSPLRTDLTDLRRPNQFKGLDRIKRPFPPVHREIINFPFLVGRVDSAHPQMLITGGQDSHKILHELDARKVEARGSIETIIQFRMIDWGMESCTLRIRLPSRNDTHTKFDVTVGKHINELEIYRLNSDSVIDLNHLSYHARPKTGEKLGTIIASYGTDWEYDFPCHFDSLYTFAIIPSTDQTSVEWWQDKQTEFPGERFFHRKRIRLKHDEHLAVYITQHATE